MRRCTAALLRLLNPSLPSHASRPTPPLPLRSLSSTPEAASEVGAGMGALEPKKANVGKAKARPTSAEAKSRVKAGAETTELSDNGVLLAENGVAHEEENAATGKAEHSTLHVKSMFDEEIAVQNAAVYRAEQEVAFSATASKSMLKTKKELSEWITKLDLSTFRDGRQWEETAYKLLDFGISPGHIMKMLPRCRSSLCARFPEHVLKHFTMLGMSHEQMGYVISRWPLFLKVSNKAFRSKVEFFESVGVDKQSLVKAMPLGYRQFGLSLSTLKGRCDFWKDCFQDVEENALRTLILKNPKILTRSLQKVMKQKIVFLQELGFSKKMILRSRRLLYELHGSTALKLHAQLHTLLALGFSFDRIQKNSLLLFYTEDHFNFRMRYAVHIMNLSVDTVVACPKYWSYGKERLEYRNEVLQELKALGAYRKNISLGYMLGMTNEAFSRNFAGKLQKLLIVWKLHNATTATDNATNHGTGLTKEKSLILKVSGAM